MGGRSRARTLAFTWIPPSCPSSTRARRGGITTSVSASLFEFFQLSLKAAAAALTALSPVVSGGAAFVFAPGSLAAAKRAGAALPSATAATIDAGTCRTDLPYLLGQGEEGSEVEACREVAQEVELEVGDTLVLVRPRHSCSGSGSGCRCSAICSVLLSRFVPAGPNALTFRLAFPRGRQARPGQRAVCAVLDVGGPRGRGNLSGRGPAAELLGAGVQVSRDLERDCLCSVRV